MNLNLLQKNVGTPRITRDYLRKNKLRHWRPDKICSFIGTSAQRAAKKGGWKKRCTWKETDWVQAMNSTGKVLLLTHPYQNTPLTQLQTYERKKYTKIWSYIKNLIMGTRSLLASGLPALKYWDKLMASGFIILLRNIPAPSVINNLGLVLRAGVSHGFMCLLGRLDEDFSLLF